MPSQLNTPEPDLQPPGDLLVPTGADTADLFGIVRRGWVIIGVCALIGMICSAMILIQMKPNYRAHAKLVFDRSISDYLRANNLVGGPAVENVGVAVQSRVIDSEVTVLPVVRSMNLANDQEFAGEPESETPLDYARDLFRTVKRQVKRLIGSGLRGSEESRNPERMAVESVLQNLNTMIEAHNVLGIYFESRSPDKAAVIANAIVDQYISSNQQRATDTTQLAGRLMRERLFQLKQQAEASERALIEYKSANNLFGTDEKTIDSEQISKLNEQLALTRVAMATARAGLESVSSVGANDTSVISISHENRLISKLRSQYMELSSRASDISSRVGKRHLAIARLSKQQSEIKSAIEAEENRIKEKLKVDYQLAKARYDELEDIVANLLKKEATKTKVKAKRLELESQANTYRTLYNNLLQRMSEKREAQTQASVFPSFRVVKRASVPVRTDSAKKKLFVIAASTLIGVLFGGLIVFSREFPFGYFRTPDQIGRATGLPCVLVPLVKTSGWFRSRNRPEFHAVAHPFSRFTESLRGVWASIKQNQMESGTKVFCIASSVSKEGKTTIATNLASYVASFSESRVLLIDADLHKRSLTKQIAPDAKVGIVEALAKPGSLHEFLTRNEGLGVDILASSNKDRIPNAAELLGSSKMEAVLAQARNLYDVIIVEVPPVGSINDLRLMEHLCDGFVFVIEWGATSQRLVIEAFMELPSILERGVCVVLNKANPKALKYIEAYKGKRHSDYYVLG